MKKNEHQRYYTEVTNTSLVNAAIYNSGPHSLGFFSPFLCVALEITLRDRTGMSMRNVRRTHTCLALAITTAAMLSVACSAKADSTLFFWAVVATTLGNALHTSGYSSNYVEIGGG